MASRSDRQKLARLLERAAALPPEPPSESRSMREFHERTNAGTATDEDWLWWFKELARQGKFDPLPPAEIERELAEFERAIREPDRRGPMPEGCPKSLWDGTRCRDAFFKVSELFDRSKALREAQDAAAKDQDHESESQ